MLKNVANMPPKRNNKHEGEGLHGDPDMFE
jgi:hypothetical protein